MSLQTLHIILISVFVISYVSIVIWLFSWSKPWSYAKNQDYFGLKWKFAIWLSPIPLSALVAFVIGFLWVI